jgi:hypothetical protein
MMSDVLIRITEDTVTKTVNLTFEYTPYEIDMDLPTHVMAGMIHAFAAKVMETLDETEEATSGV